MKIQSIVQTLLLLVGVLLAAGCKESGEIFEIRGTLPSEKYDGEWIYLVPLRYAAGRVDSVRVVNATFHFKGEGEEMRVLRVKPLLRLAIQELLVVTEPGTILVKADSVGSVTGTPQNDRLQQWKIQRDVQNRLLPPLWYAWTDNRDSADYRAYRLVADSLREQEKNFTFRMLMDEGNSTLGRFFFRNFKELFTKEQRAELEAKGLGEGEDEINAQKKGSAQ